jgi:hypothetical protein
MKDLKYKQAIVPLFGTFISLFPRVIISPMESIYGEGDHFSLGHVVVAFIVLLCCFYSIVITLNLTLKKRWSNALMQFTLCFIQLLLLSKHVGYF